ncbi:helix-turn-helix transcriptional regulator [Nocardia fluminea]|uniref:Helix-turn-helix protein n=1 Tax=Nocardia fluminea TaxID=134984 RepID=A0A2N3VG80_9NOCA|nr:helix-turn-helix transcriptional regulator [Nocardia fluminea]PKV80605.1 helix-turn-helix protein [Nocardia fluminea]
MVSAASARRREELRDFLRARRARIGPGDVGLPVVGRRRTPGLRREEVAMLAGVGVSWYTWLEQGREITVSGEVLDAVAGVLRLSVAERAHLYVLAGLNPPVARGSAVEVSAEIRALIDGWVRGPAVVRDRYWNILAFNVVAGRVFGCDDGEPHNCLVSFFTSPRYRGVPDLWADAAPGVVAAYRADAALLPHDGEFQRVATELAASVPEFAALWQRHDVGAPLQAVNALRHPEAGDLYFDATTLTVADHPHWSLVLYNPKPNTDTADRLAALPHLRISESA